MKTSEMERTVEAINQRKIVLKKIADYEIDLIDFCNKNKIIYKSLDIYYLRSFCEHIRWELHSYGIQLDKLRDE